MFKVQKSNKLIVNFDSYFILIAIW